MTHSVNPEDTGYETLSTLSPTGQRGIDRCHGSWTPELSRSPAHRGERMELGSARALGELIWHSVRRTGLALGRLLPASL